MTPASAKVLTPISELLKLGKMPPYITLGGKLYGSQKICEALMTLLSATDFFGLMGIELVVKLVFIFCGDGNSCCSCVQDAHGYRSLVLEDYDKWVVLCVEGVYCGDGVFEVYAVSLGMVYGCWYCLDW